MAQLVTFIITVEEQEDEYISDEIAQEFLNKLENILSEHYSIFDQSWERGTY